MDWKEIDLSTVNPELDPFASIGNGCIRLSKGACALIKDFDKCNYVSFLRAKKDRVYFLGLKFSENKNKVSIPFAKIEDNVYGAIISSENVVHTFYGYEGIDKKYTKHNVTTDKDDPEIIIIYYNYKTVFYESGNSNKRVRTKHIGQIVNGEWLVESSRAKTKTASHPVYILKNIKTNEKIEISSRALIDIERGVTSVENIKKCREMGTAKWLGKRRALKKRKLKAIDDEKYVHLNHFR